MSLETLIPFLKSFPLFCENFLVIKTKYQGVKPFVLNRAQKILHEKFEEQRKQTGRVRALILKGRQMGISTMIQARLFHKVITQRGQKAFILTHEAEATENLFNITKRFVENLPAGLAPDPDTSSAKKLNFLTLDSGYAVGTAGNKSVGRSQTVQLFHGSETAFWPHAEEHAAGIMQAVPDAINTEIILETTANGLGNYFYKLWVSAIQGNSEFEPIFLPWYWADDYKIAYQNESLTDEEKDLLAAHEKDHLTKEHLMWRRKKLSQLSNDVERFKVEYPMNWIEAFRNPIADRFIKAEQVNLARKNEIKHNESKLVIGVDPAISDHDRCAIIRRRGREVYKAETFYNLNTMELVGQIRKIIETERPHKVYIDCIGIGAGIVDRLIEAGYSQVEGINVARRAEQHDSYKNLRAELWARMKEWLSGEMPVSLPDSDELQGDLTSLGYKYDSSARLQIESKDDLRKRGMKSPDLADALALTFYEGSYVQSAYKPATLSEQSAGLLI